MAKHREIFWCLRIHILFVSLVSNTFPNWQERLSRLYWGLWLIFEIWIWWYIWCIQQYTPLCAFLWNQEIIRREELARLQGFKSNADGTVVCVASIITLDLRVVLFDMTLKTCSVIQKTNAVMLAYNGYVTRGLASGNDCSCFMWGRQTLEGGWLAQTEFIPMLFPFFRVCAFYQHHPPPTQ